jgi:hypothetical protein
MGNKGATAGTATRATPAPLRGRVTRDACERGARRAKSRGDTLDLGGLSLSAIPAEVQALHPLRRLYLGLHASVRQKPLFSLTSFGQKLCNAVSALPDALISAQPQLELLDPSVQPDRRGRRPRHRRAADQPHQPLSFGERDRRGRRPRHRRAADQPHQPRPRVQPSSFGTARK